MTDDGSFNRSVLRRRGRVSRVAFVIGQCGPGGTEQQAALLVRGLVERGVSVDVLILEGGPQGQQFGTAHVRQLGPLCRGRLPRAWAVGLAALRLARALHHGRYDCVHATLARSYVVTPFVAHTLRPRPLVVAWRRNLGIHRKADGARARLERWVTRLTDVIVCNATSVETYWRADSGSDRTTWHVVPNALEPWRFAAVGVGDHADSRLSLVTVGSLRPVKGHGVLLESMALLEDRRAVDVAIIGDGPLGPELAQQAERLGLPLELPGHVDDTRPWLAGASLYVHPSYSEGSSNAIAEAMAQGCAVVATDVGGSRELLGDTGVLVPPGDVKKLADALERLLTSPATRRRLGEAARERAERDLSVSAFVDRHIEIYEEARACVASPA